MPSEKEYQLIKAFVLLPFLLTLFQRDINIISHSNIKIKTPYIYFLHSCMDKVVQDLANIRKQMKLQGIKVYEEKRHQDGITYGYSFKGYHHTFTMLTSYLKAELEKKMNSYLGLEAHSSGSARLG